MVRVEICQGESAVYEQTLEETGQVKELVNFDASNSTGERKNSCDRLFAKFF